ncbi:hypothetical protein F4604DRAFT_1927497 [Suillus subluteus]|nr:hypothetical protein F4604DRAFT_1927497 [Suillus subluteus]
MPALRPPRPCRSARLKALESDLRKAKNTMESIQPPVTCGRGKGRTSQGCLTTSTGTSSQDQTRPSKFTVQWQADPRCTEKVMEYLCAHTTDCHVLFYLDNKSHADGDRPSAKGKLSICQIIAKHIFEKDSEYSNHYHHEPEKFCDSTNSHISGLRKKYCEFHDKLHLTGAGITPLDEMTLTNLHTQIMEEFCWYDDLASILGENPAVSLKTILLVPGVNHTGNYFSLVQRSTAENVQSASSQYGGYVPSTQPPLLVPSRDMHGFWKPAWVMGVGTCWVDTQKQIVDTKTPLLTPYSLHTMQLNLLSKTAKRVTKLTDKAKAAIKEKLDGASTEKRKNHTSGESMVAIKSKNAKATPPDGSGDGPSLEEITPPPQLAPVPPALVVCRAIVRTEEEEAALYNDVIDIDADDDDAERQPSSPDVKSVESAADELSMSTLVQANLHINKNIERCHAWYGVHTMTYTNSSVKGDE